MSLGYNKYYNFCLAVLVCVWFLLKPNIVLWGRQAAAGSTPVQVFQQMASAWVLAISQHQPPNMRASKLPNDYSSNHLVTSTL